MADAHRGEGATAERERIRGIEENALPGYEAIVAEAKESVVEGTVEERAKAKWDKDAGLRAEFGAFETFLAWTKASEAGLAKVFAGRK